VSPRAAVAIVSERLRAERRAVAFACAGAAIAGYVQSHAFTFAAPMFFCSTIGIALALLQGPGRHPYLDTSERSAPLFGRELARAKALAPAMSATLVTLVYWGAQSASGSAMPPTHFILALACVLASTLVALNATILSGAARDATIVLAALTIVVAFALATSGERAGAAAELIFCALSGFFALRQYGESLARYDPL